MTNPSTEDITIPAELAESLRRAATRLPGSPPDLTEVHGRRRHRQLRRSGAALAGIGALVAASLVTPRLLAGPIGPDESAAPAVTASPTLAQRLLGGPGRVVVAPHGLELTDLPDRPDPSRPNYGFPPGSAGVVQVDPWEVTAEGDVVPVELPGEQRRGFHLLGDGRIVTLEWRTLSGAPRHDALCSHDAADYLRLYDTDGTMSFSRNVRVRCEETSIVGATETEVLLVHTPHDEQTLTPTTGRRLVAYNLTDGSERTVANLDALPVHPTSWDVNVDAGRIVTVADSYGCQVETLDIDTGVVTTLDVTALVADCGYVDQIRLSPDGRRLAIAYRTAGPVNQEPYDAGFAVVDLAGPALLLREVVASVPPAVFAPHGWGGEADAIGDNGTVSRYYPAGIAWSDNSAVRIAWVWLPEELNRVVGIDEVLNVRAFTVP